MRLHVPIRLRWSDLDAYAHVNNAEMLRLLEEARIQAFWVNDEAAGASGARGTAVLDGRPGAATLTLIARMEIEYLAPIPYLREPIDVQLWIGKLGGASLDVCYEVYGPAGQESAPLYARATTTIVLVDAATERPRKINDVERAAWTPYLEPAVPFTRK
ncbi:MULTISPECIES: acyl-CoA thioesterase [Cryobacterium]|uniref:4-hydroxybenzoyl-CoA thioesterase n=1 Tax=Cryobacterium zongtaii TaxID=1259217 RepID=A0A2S3Z8K5_9MICO|nr:MULTISPECIES: thioesterase family protein [Cryobacterium]MEC5184407.1 acyl-CoA thioester hydrolase [Cryobacterium sp. MP_3.1]POH61889.1 4-hydroxybenzoyl-CoA thioesterase [Cryobacterium zongtaii]POH65657.1 4-hydroxybenzoyl-CoA thioesterase [Cryobacterium zongtaii]POH67573.1 4-hydroxybenzoyl-CoA thioesterase [Cryobacterium zongtaii]TFC45357.1 acyl-CoA thioesterase [Cryobacterium sp. TMN-39-2]